MTDKMDYRVIIHPDVDLILAARVAKKGKEMKVGDLWGVSFADGTILSLKRQKSSLTIRFNGPRQ